MKRALLLVLGLLLLIGLAAVIGLSLLAPVGESEPDVPKPPVIEGPTEDGRADLAALDISDAEARRRRLRYPWPFADFIDDIARVRQPGRAAAYVKRKDIETSIYHRLDELKLTIRLEEPTVDQVVGILSPVCATEGIKVWTQPPEIPSSIKIERLYLTDVSVRQVLSALTALSDDFITFAVTPNGLCVGSKPACYQARIDANAWEAQARAEASVPDDDAFLDVEYRPDWKGAHIGAVIDDIRRTTNVQVVVDEAAWGAPFSLTWRADPVPLREALRRIGKELGAGLYVADGRAFLLAR